MRPKCKNCGWIMTEAHGDDEESCPGAKHMRQAVEERRRMKYSTIQQVAEALRDVRDSLDPAPAHRHVRPGTGPGLGPRA
jgi:hypothetical protein